MLLVGWKGHKHIPLLKKPASVNSEDSLPDQVGEESQGEKLGWEWLTQVHLENKMTIKVKVVVNIGLYIVGYYCGLYVKLAVFEPLMYVGPVSPITDRSTVKKSMPRGGQRRERDVLKCLCEFIQPGGCHKWPSAAPTRCEAQQNLLCTHESRRAREPAANELDLHITTRPLRAAMIIIIIIIII